MGTQNKNSDNRDSKIITVGHFATTPHKYYLIPWSEIARVMPSNMQSVFAVYLWKHKIKRSNDGVSSFTVSDFLKQFYLKK